MMDILKKISRSALEQTKSIILDDNTDTTTCNMIENGSVVDCELRDCEFYDKGCEKTYKEMKA